MAKLPELPTDTVETPQIRSSVSGAEVAAASPFAVGADAAASIGKIADDYEKGVALGQTAQEISDAQTNALTLSQKANGDANAFQQSWTAYMNARLPEVAQPYRADVQAKLIDIGGATQRQILGDTYQRDQKVAADSVSARQDSLLTQMTDMARAGQTDTPAYQALHTEYVGLINDKVSNPFFAYSQDHANLDTQAAEDQLLGATVSGELERTYQSDGYAAAQKRAQSIYEDTSNGLSPLQKLKAIQEGLKSVNALYAQDSEARKQFSADRQSVVSALGDGSLDPDDPLVAGMLAQADQMRDPVSRMALQAAQEKARLNPTTSMNLHDRLNFISDLAGGADMTRGLRNNNPLNIEAGAFASSQPGYTGSDGRFAQFATRDQGLAAADSLLATYGRQGINTVAGVVGKWAPASDGNDTTAYAKTVADKLGVKPGDAIDLSDAGTRQKLASAMATVESGPGATTAPQNPLGNYSKGLVPEVRSSIETGLASALTQADDALNHDRPLDAGQMQDLVDAARIVDKGDTYDKVQSIFARSAAVSALVGQPVGDQQAFVDKLRAPGPVGEEALRMATLDQAVATHNRMADLLDKDPRALGVQLGLFQPGPAVNFTNLGQVPQILAQRVPQMQRLEQAEHSGPLPVLRPEEAKALSAAWQGANADQKTQLLGALASALPAPTLMATLGQFAEKKETQTLAVAGALSATNPAAAASIVRGEAALAANPKFGFDEGNADDQQTRSDYFPTTTVAPSMVGAWQAHLDAAKAIYADASAKAGDASGKFNQDRWQTAIDTVTGGLVDFNGQKTIAPAPGIDQRRFDSVMASLPRAAFDGAVTPDGTPITADFVRRFGTLQGYADGRYVIGLGDTGAYAMSAARTPSEAGRSGPFVLDLRPYLAPGAVPAGSSPIQGTIDAAKRIIARRQGLQW